MNAKDLLRGLGEFWQEYRKTPSGIAGLAILLAYLLLALLGPLLVPFPGATEHWQDIAFWQDNPSAAPPAWTNWLSARKGAVSARLAPDDALSETYSSAIGDRTSVIAFAYDYRADSPPRDIILRLKGSGKTSLSLEAERPDGARGEIYRAQAELGPDWTRASIEHDALAGVLDLIGSVDEYIGSSIDRDGALATSLLFSKVEEDMASSPTALKGKYSFRLRASLLSADARVEAAEILVAGEVSGIMGTDASKRDVFTGIVAGIKWALLVGFLASVVTVVAGVILGVAAAYYGGAVDWILTRLYEYVYLLPVLPFLIVVSAIYKPSIYTLIAIVCLLFWCGPFKPVYSMALQIKEETYVEASRALGSGRMRIIARHVVPVLLPYSFAVMAMSIPGIIVYEASVSLLGLGDSGIVTWGQMLQAAQSQNATIKGLWWWVVPPGLMIALMGMAFAFIGSAMDRILHPKLRTR